VKNYPAENYPAKNYPGEEYFRLREKFREISSEGFSGEESSGEKVSG
jgi:hypothetical protein